MSATLAYALGVLVLVVGIALSVALHELGHMLPAKAFGVKVPEYFIGFGPRLWSFHRGGTEYGVKAVWLGGYVRLLGMLPPARPGRPDKPGGMVAEAREESLAELGPDEQHRAFYRLSVPRKLVVMAGGILTNLVLGVLLLAVALGVVGQPGYTATVATVSACVSSDIDAGAGCTATDPVSPARAAGLEPGDRLLTWAGAPLTSWADVQAAILANGTGPSEVVVERGGQRLTLTVTAVEVERTVHDEAGQPVTGEDGTVLTHPRPYAGLSPALGTVRVPAGEVAGQVASAVGQTLRAIITIPAGLYHAVLAGLGAEERSPEGLISLVGMGRIAGEVSAAGAGTGRVPFSARLYSMLSLLGSLNLALFAFNLVPLLPLDGGHVAGACWEGLRRTWARATGRPDPGYADTARMLPVGQVVFGLLILMAVLLIWVDLVAPL
ncbi:MULTISPECIES: site-2 protease family protein [unclassified Actinomyces]|uniref:M50 family metallopeptidase n=1 Tax=unclassified Actinomyces TaxID=2609248 RepID=UPI002016E72D|nr:MULTISPECIES: site-2 protease family protein [unclassified Actinomyces]MCL3778571.1 site-2 protease family protein [Actinomyces sp. AC-20-1]MCL3789596.1 site-2 protease family protein [Actinomyces sp. 187325]MCL3792243.1 site-2 protease family protein [Actinomyces sp. 186855]MCL3794527.1 site-2 protease family protein [Actinomyces sp. 217892]